MDFASMSSARNVALRNSLTLRQAQSYDCKPYARFERKRAFGLRRMQARKERWHDQGVLSRAAIRMGAKLNDKVDVVPPYPTPDASVECRQLYAG